ncbi:MAG: VTT domain-containing protein [Methylococcaceae bacterium]|nr:VTT domain-containing protein [Methylococcaceae bacterium]
MNVHLQTEAERPKSRIGGIVNGGFFIAIMVLGAAIYFTPLKTWLDHGQAIKDHLALFGMAAPLVFIFAAALLTAIGAPRLLLCSLGGMTFGFAWGLLWTQFGTLLGSYLTFLLVRWRGRDYVLNHFPRLRGFSQNLGSRGLLSVLLIRQLPLNGFYNNLLLGLTPVGHADFLLGSLLGFLPLGITACLLGAGLIQGDILKGVQYLALALACSAILGYGLKCMAKPRAANAEDGPSHE